ncbi:MAG TPA: MarR family transcriptional regulator [Ktedonobacterales bacterium]|nr:MarR family transcriptional regulator [Ktedonobacterales bacterium]
MDREKSQLEEHELAAWRALLYAHAAVIERIECELVQAGSVPLTAYDVLIALREAPDRRLRMQELAHAVVLNRSTLTRRVDRLEAEGLLRRERCGTDKRGAYAVLTEKGMDALRHAWPIYARGIQEYFAQHLTAGELTTLTTGLGRVFHAAQET